MHKRSLREDRENPNEVEFFSLGRTDRKYDERRKEAFDKGVMEIYEKYMNEKFYYRQFEIDDITYKLYKYLTTILYTRERDKVTSRL